MDYWDYLGWRDTFADRKFTERQKRYARAAKRRGLVTPQLLVDGKPQGKNQLKAAVQRGAAEKARLKIAAEAASKGGKVSVRIRLEKLDAKLELGKGVEVTAVLFQRRATTKCDAGENKGKSLEEFFAVVAAGPAGAVKDALDKGVTATFTAPKGVEAGNLGVAVLVEDATTMENIACVSVPVKEKPG